MHDKNGGLALNSKVLDLCEELFNQNCRSNHLLGTIIDICQERQVKNEFTHPFFNIERAIQVLVLFS